MFGVEGSEHPGLLCLVLGMNFVMDAMQHQEGVVMRFFRWITETIALEGLVLSLALLLVLVILQWSGGGLAG
jgi:hypothetical protein